MAPSRVRFGADGPRWAIESPHGSRILHVSTDNFTVVHCRSNTDAEYIADELVGEAAAVSRRTHVRWLGLECVWKGRGQPALAVALCTPFTAAVLSLHEVGRVMPGAWATLLGATNFHKACGSISQWRRALEDVHAPVYRLFDIARLAELHGLVRGSSWALSDVLVRLKNTTVPMERHLRALYWSCGLSDEQGNLLALHAYGALRVAEEVQLPMDVRAAAIRLHRDEGPEWDQ